VSKDLDDNDRLRAGQLPDDPAEGTGPAPAPPREETADERDAREKREAAAKAEALLDAEAAKRLRPGTLILAGLPQRWENPAPCVSTGIAQFDRLLNGGLRGGDMLAFAGAAKAGKSTFMGQVGFDFAKGPEVPGDQLRGLLVYVSVEMPDYEIMSRWITREAFKLTLERRTPWMDYGAVLYGRAWRGEVTRDPTRNEAIRRTLVDAMRRVDSVVGPPEAPHVYVQRAPMGTTPWDIRRYMRAARAGHPDGTPVLLIVDPMQRLLAGTSDLLSARALERINAEESARVALVAAQLRTIAEDDNVAVLLGSDTTKENVRTSSGSSTGMRGSYEINHWTTGNFMLHGDEDASELADRIVDGRIVPKSQKEELERRLLDCVPDWFTRETAVAELGRCYAFVDCSGVRNAKKNHVCMGYVTGAMAFIEGDGLQL
jgi:hypothetical protein